MTERLSDVRTRIGTVEQLAAVIGAMRGIAAARSREARAHLVAIRRYADTIGAAIGRALTFQAEPEAPAARWNEKADTHVVIALCAEQGFAGTFSDHVLDAVLRLATAAPVGGTEVLLIGDHGHLAARARGLRVVWSAPMIVHAGQLSQLSNQITEALYERLDARDVARVTVVHALPGEARPPQMAETRLVPFDFGRFPVPRAAAAPLLNLAPHALLESLVEEYVFAALCEAVMLSHAAENEARMRAMIAARTNVANKLTDLRSLSQRLRQEEITSEIVELASGAMASPG